MDKSKHQHRGAHMRSACGLLPVVPGSAEGALALPGLPTSLGSEEPMRLRGSSAAHSSSARMGVLGPLPRLVQWCSAAMVARRSFLRAPWASAIRALTALPGLHGSRRLEIPAQAVAVVQCGYDGWSIVS